MVPDWWDTAAKANVGSPKLEWGITAETALSAEIGVGTEYTAAQPEVAAATLTATAYNSLCWCWCYAVAGVSLGSGLDTPNIGGGAKALISVDFEYSLLICELPSLELGFCNAAISADILKLKAPSGLSGTINLLSLQVAIDLPTNNQVPTPSRVVHVASYSTPSSGYFLGPPGKDCPAGSATVQGESKCFEHAAEAVSIDDDVRQPFNNRGCQWQVQGGTTRSGSQSIMRGNKIGSMQKPRNNYATTAADCCANSQCKGFSNNPSDWTFFYTSTGGFGHRGNYPPNWLSRTKHALGDLHVVVGSWTGSGKLNLLRGAQSRLNPDWRRLCSTLCTIHTRLADT